MKAWSHGRSGYRYVEVPGRGRVYEHMLIVESVLQKPLPSGAVVHHVDGVGSHNAKTNLVACQDQEYHLLLHRRQNARTACGDANKVRCRHCKQWDHEGAMKVFQLRKKNGTPNGWNSYHPACHARVANERYHNQKAAG